jgi:hypothetical protein
MDLPRRAFEQMLATYVYSHYNIPIYFCNIHVKHLQHAYKTPEHLKHALATSEEGMERRGAAEEACSGSHDVAS